jgi:hypothetical protein
MRRLLPSVFCLLSFPFGFRVRYTFPRIRFTVGPDAELSPSAGERTAGSWRCARSDNERTAGSWRCARSDNERTAGSWRCARSDNESADFRRASRTANALCGSKTAPRWLDYRSQSVSTLLRIRPRVKLLFVASCRGRRGRPESAQRMRCAHKICRPIPAGRRGQCP